MGSLHPFALFDALGIEFVVKPVHSVAKMVGMPVNWEACIEWTSQGPVVVSESMHPSNLANALHEAVHVLFGSDSFDDESDLMVFEWMVAQELAPDWYVYWRNQFSGYQLSNGDVGRSDAFLKSSKWSEMVQEASESLAFHDGAPIWGQGPNPNIGRRLIRNAPWVDTREENLGRRAKILLGNGPPDSSAWRTDQSILFQALRTKDDSSHG